MTVDPALITELTVNGDTPEPLFPMNGCACPSDQGRLCDDCTGLVEHLNHQTVRVCAFAPCGKPLAPRPGESPWHFRRRTCCNASCANRRTQGSTAPLDLPAEKTCDECGETTTRRDKESPARWAARRFCSRLCASRYGIRQGGQKPPPVVETKTCVECGGVMFRRSNERTNRWKLRECCSRSCASRRMARRLGKTVGKSKPAQTVRKPTPAPVLPPAPVERPVGPVWRPVGFSKIPNQWAGHRPPEDEAAS